MIQILYTMENILFPKQNKNIKHIGINLRGKIEDLFFLISQKFLLYELNKSPETNKYM